MEQSPRTDEFNGYIRVKIDPDETGNPDISINVNNHISLLTDGVEADGAAARKAIESAWEPAMRRARQIIEAIASI